MTLHPPVIGRPEERRTIGADIATPGQARSVIVYPMMKTLNLAALVAASTLLFSACAEMRWAKTGADAPTVARDLNECRAGALTGGGPRAPGIATQDAQMIDRGASPSAARPAGTSNDRFIAEHEDVRVCMLRRGYQLQPAG